VTVMETRVHRGRPSAWDDITATAKVNAKNKPLTQGSYSAEEI
jgi:hypothetical protein